MFARRVRNQPVAAWLVCLSLILSGCASPRPAVIQVLDAETKRPIPDAEISIWYPTDAPGHSGNNARARTQPDGIAQVQLLPDEGSCPLAELSARGYLWEEKSLPGGVPQLISCRASSAKNEPHGPDVVFELYAEPRPSVELVVPNLYRGLIEVKMQILTNAPTMAGLRAFQAVVSPQGTAEVTGPAILRYVGGAGFKARFADGTAIPRDTKEFDEVGFWWLRGDESEQLFLVGTKTEYESHRKSATQDESAKTRSSSGGKGGGRGGRGGGGRHGGGSPDGSGSNGGSPTAPDQ